MLGWVGGGGRGGEKVFEMLYNGMDGMGCIGSVKVCEKGLHVRRVLKERTVNLYQLHGRRVQERLELLDSWY